LQTGFGSPSVAAGLATLRRLSTDFTVLAEFAHFHVHDGD